MIKLIISIIKNKHPNNRNTHAYIADLNWQFICRK